MKKTKVLFVLLLTLTLILAVGCGQQTGDAQDDSGQSTDAPSNKDIGKKYQSVFFDFSVDSVEFGGEFFGHSAPEDMQLINAVITIKNTFGEEIPMSIGDFQLQWHDLGDKDDDYTLGVELEGVDNVMPNEYSMADKETVTYNVVFEAPADATEFSISYFELFDDDTTGDSHFAYFDKK